MPRHKKKASELTTDEALKRLFPKSVIQRLKEEVAAADKPKKRKSK